MPSFRECIVKAAKAGIVNKQQEEELLKSFDDQLELFSKTLSELEIICIFAAVLTINKYNLL